MAGLLALDNSTCSWNYHVMWSCYVLRDRLNIGIKTYSMTSCTCPSDRKTTVFFCLAVTGNANVYKSSFWQCPMVPSRRRISGVFGAGLPIAHWHSREQHFCTGHQQKSCLPGRNPRNAIIASLWTLKNESSGQRCSILIEAEGLFSSQSFHQLIKIP